MASDIRHKLVSRLCWAMMLVAVSPLLVLAIISGIGVLILFIAAAAYLEALLMRRESLRRAASSMLAMSASRLCVVDASTISVVPQERGIVGRAVRRLLKEIADGVPPTEAIRAHPRALPREAFAYASVGELIGAQDVALRELARPENPVLASVWKNCVDPMLYLYVFVILTKVVFAYILTRILPEFRKIFAEFQLELPALTESVVVATDAFSSQFGGFVLAGVAIFVQATFVVCILYVFDLRVLEPMGDLVFRSRRVASVLRLMALSADQRYSFAPIFEKLAAIHPARSIRRKLRPISREVTAGGHWRTAMYRAGLIRSADNALLGTAEEVGNLPWALRAIAAQTERRLAYRLAAFVQVVYPLVILVLGGVVGMFVIAMFVPLVRLIEALS